MGDRVHGPALYNEIDSYAAGWLRNLIAAGHIAAGDVEARSIRELQPVDLRGRTQAHFFAGIGVWSYALRLAGWPDELPVWTGSCPCQPFSAAGKRGGFDDARHLWPDWFRLIRECRPPVVLGEQVASPDGLRWFDLVSSDLEAEGYAVGAADLCAAGVGAPHIRQRLYFVAHANEGVGRQVRALAPGGNPRGDAEPRAGLGGGRGAGELGNTRVARLEGLAGHGDHGDQPGRVATNAAGSASTAGAPGGVEHSAGEQERVPGRARFDGITAGFWRDAEWIPCVDDKWRAVEPGTFPLAHGAAARVGRLRGYGNALNAETARCFVTAVLQAMEAA
jgi:DNA (cytosine-5)-methyltransferase 1